MQAQTTSGISMQWLPSVMSLSHEQHLYFVSYVYHHCTPKLLMHASRFVARTISCIHIAVGDMRKVVCGVSLLTRGIFTIFRDVQMLLLRD